MSNKSGVASQVLPLPQGGGALRGIGETFTPDLFTGTGNLSVPIALPAGRAGLQPQLTLAYSTTNGNGPFGLGWTLGVPSITRKTSKGLPRYRDHAPDLAIHDTFVLSGAEDLVRIGLRDPDTKLATFRPRTEGLFGLIEHVLSDDDATNVWRVRSKDGLVSVYGSALEGRAPGDMQGDARNVIANPSEPAKVFSWLLSETRDTFGNRIEYAYRRDRQVNGRSWDQLYLARIRYVDLADGRFLASVKFMYEECERPDAFSSHRSGFEIRTRFRCRRIEVHTDFDGDHPLRTYNLTYLDQVVPDGERPKNGISLLNRIEVVGHDGDTPETLPPLDFRYTVLDDGPREFQPLSASGGGLPTVSLADPGHELVDLYGRGLPDLVEMNGDIRFWRNRGDGTFADMATMEAGPHDLLLSDDGVRFADLNGDGRSDLLVIDDEGYYPLRFGGEFFKDRFVSNSLPPFEFEGKNTRFIDLDGDGVVDAMQTGAKFRLFFNRSEERKWDDEERTRGPVEAGLRFEDPQVKLADLSGDGLQDFVFVTAGAQNRVKVRYWPNRGDGRFGDAIDMTDGPEIDDNTGPPSLGFEPTRLLMTDVDGDGLDDILYIDLQRRTVSIWFNQSGNGWSLKPMTFTVPTNLLFDGADGVRLNDLLGSGTAGVLWTSDRRPGNEENYQFLDLTRALKPYLLTEIDNHMGAMTRVQYAPSTKFYLRDESQAGAKWKTPLPFPVHVVERVEVIDELSKGKLTSEYRYHHGYWDGTEREFRGFGMVEQLDTEVRTDFNAVGLHGDAHEFNRVTEPQFSPPVLTKTWFHLGDIDDETLEDQGKLPEVDLSEEYFQGDPPLLVRPEEQIAVLARLPDHGARREALRTLRGTTLRTEMWAPAESARPFTVTETLMGLREVEADLPKRQRVFFPHQLAQRTTKWEGGNDPMTSFTCTGDYDEFGQPRRETKIACPRGWRGLEDTPGKSYLATQTRSEFARPKDLDVFIVDRVARSTTFEILNNGSKTLVETKDDADSGSALKVIQQTLSFYDGPGFVGLPNGDVGVHGALVRTETLALTEEILKQGYEPEKLSSDAPTIPPYLNPDGPPAWTDEYPIEFRSHIESLPHIAGYIFHDGDAVTQRGYFASSARNQYDFQVPGAPGARGLLRAVRDPLGRDPAPGEPATHDTAIEYEFNLLPSKVTDPVGLVTEAHYDARVLQPAEVIDPNGNRTLYTYTPLGLLKEIAVLGKQGEFAGDEVSLPDGVQRLPSTRFEYDFLSPANSRPDKRLPVSVHTIRRVHHISETDVTDEEERHKTVETVEYSDGFGRLLQTRTLAEDDTVGDPIFGDSGLSSDQSIDPGEIVLRARVVDKDPNVVVSGAQVYDNKGRVIEKFEPYFDLEAGLAYQAPTEAQHGQRISMFYDALGRLIRARNPDGSEQRVIHGVPGSIRGIDVTTPDVFEPTPWEAYTYDANDLAPLSREPQADGSPGPLLTDRAPRHHHFTPSSIVVDALGRTVLSVARNRQAPNRGEDTLPLIEEIETRTEYDIPGNVLTVIDARQREAFTYVYDLVNKPLRMKGIDAGIRRTVFDGSGNEIERRDSKGAVILQAFDRLQRPIRLWARDDKTSEVTLRERQEYGDAGDPDQPEPARQQNRALNRLGVLHRHYDEAGRLELEAYDFKGNVLEKRRRVIRDDAILSLFPSRRDRAADWNIRAFRVNWDPLEEQKQTLLADQPFEISTEYDALNRVKRLLYPRDVKGLRKELRPTYNRAGALEKVSLDGNPFVEHIAYDAKGQRTFVALGNRVMTFYAYDPSTFRLSRMFTTRFTRPGDRTFLPAPLTSPKARKENLHQDFAYDHDLVGNITRIHDRTPESGIINSLLGRDALDRTFEYDAIYRLTRATGREVDHLPEHDPDAPFDPGPRQTDVTKARAHEQRYRYDVLGNIERLEQVAGSGTFTRHFAMISVSNRLETLKVGDGASTTFKYAYDDGGNLVQENTERHFEWDHSNRMKVFRTQVDRSEPSVHVHYLYDAGGQRVTKLVRKQSGHTEITHYIDRAFAHHQWQRSGEEPEANSQLHVSEEQQRIAMVRTGDPHPEDKGPDVQYQFGDHLGSSNVVLSADGGFVNREEYTSYGETSFGSFARKRYRFTGQERDQESGWYYHGARYYAPWLVRWASPDPQGFSISSEDRTLSCPYAYMSHRPVTRRDPDGRQGRLVSGQENVVWWVVIVVAVGGLLKSESTLNDPRPGAKRTSMVRTAVETVKFGVSIGVGGAAGGALGRGTLGLTGSQGLAHVVGATTSGISGSVTYRAMGDIERGEISSFDEYARDAAIAALVALPLSMMTRTGGGGSSTRSGTQQSESTSGGRTVRPSGNTPSPENQRLLPNLTEAELESAVSSPRAESILLQAPPPTGARVHLNGPRLIHELTVQARTSAQGAVGDVATRIRVHSPGSEAPAGSNSATGNILTITQGGGARRLTPGPTPAGTWHQTATATDEVMNQSHIPIHRE